MRTSANEELGTVVENNPLTVFVAVDGDLEAVIDKEEGVAKSSG